MPIKEIIKDRKQLSVPCIETTLEAARPVIQDLMDTANFHKKKCAGLAANQIGYQERVFVIKIRGKFVAFINPSWHACASLSKGIEGCLSFPGKRVSVWRARIISTSPPRGKKKGIILSGFEAVAFQHEHDHLDGKSIV